MLSTFIKLFVGVVLALVLFGVVGGVDLVYLIGALVLLRLWVLLRHWFRTPATQSDWDALRQVFWEQLEALDAEAAVEIRLELGLPVGASNEEVVDASTQQAMEAYRPPRAKVELLCEFVGLLSYLLLAPFVFALFGLDFVALNLPLTWTAFVLILVSAVAYFAPFYVWKEANSIRSRCIWWCLPFVPLLLLSLYGVEVRHPYLNPMHPERYRIAAERVLAMSDIVSSGRHAGIVKRYGQVLEDAGEVREALAVYQHALLLNASDHALRSDVERISQELGIVERRVELEQTGFERRIFTGPIRTIDLGLELSELDEFTVVLVSVGAVSDRVKMKVAEAIREELSVDVMMVGAELPLPEHTRRRGFVTGKQWEANAIIGAFLEAYPNCLFRQ